MGLIQEIDYGTKKPDSNVLVTVTIDGQKVQVAEGTSIMRAAMEAGIQGPKLCASDMLDSFGSCRVCLVEVEGRNGLPASCTTPVANDMVVRTQTERLKAVRKGVMELYISDHPLNCLTCSANGDCELQDVAGAVGLRADHRGPRLRQPGLGQRPRGVHGLRVRELRRLRAGLPNGDAEREICDLDRHAGAFRGHDLRLLRGGVHLQGGDARRGGRAHGSLQGRQGQPRA